MSLYRRAMVGLLLLSPSMVFAGSQLVLDSARQQALEIGFYQVGESASELSDPVVARLKLSDEHQRVLTLPVSGTIQKLSVLPGTPVAAGADLGLIHSREALALQREYLGAIDRLERQQASKQRDQSLYEGGAIAKKRWQQTLAEWRQGDAMVSELASQLAAVGFTDDELVQLQGNRKIRSLLPLRAPIEGVVLERYIQPGEAFAAGEKLFHIGDAGQLWLAIEVPPGLAVRTRSADPVYYGGDVIGQVLQVGVSVEQASQSVSLTAQVTVVPPPGLMPGQSLLVRLQFLDRQGLWLPRESVVNIGGDSAVFIAEGDNFELRVVDVVPARGGWAALSGLSSGEQVVTSGASVLKGVLMGLGGGSDDGH